MSAAKSYAAPVEIGGVMEGGTVAEVIDSRRPDFAVGTSHGVTPTSRQAAVGRFVKWLKP